MKISVSTDNELVSEHFGRCPEFTIAEIKNGKIVNEYKITNPGHTPGVIPGYLDNEGVDLIICGGIGTRAKELFNMYNIDVIAGVFGTVRECIDAYLKGELKGGKSFCVPGKGKGYGIEKEECDHNRDG